MVDKRPSGQFQSVSKTILTLVILCLIGILVFTFMWMTSMLNQAKTKTSGKIHIQHSPDFFVYQFVEDKNKHLQRKLSKIAGKFKPYVAVYALNLKSELSLKFQKKYDIQEFPCLLITDKSGKVVKVLKGEEVEERAQKTIRNAVFGEHPFTGAEMVRTKAP